ncbi:hypothetical protein Tco_0630457 [Tanacetum coccineum]
MTDVEKADAEKTEEAKGHNEKVGNELAKVDQAKDVYAQDNQATTLASVTHKVMPEIPPTSSSLSVLSGFGNQFLNLSSDTFLSPTLLNAHVSVILEQTVLKPTLIVTTITSMLQHTTPIPTPPIVSETPLVTIVYDPLPAVIQRLFDLENKFKAWTRVDHFEAIEASVQANVINEVKNQLPKVVKDLVKSRMESTVQNALQKDPINLEKHESQKDTLEIHEDDIDKVVVADPSTQLNRKHDDQDEDPTARSDQGNEKKKPRKDT